MEFAFVRNGREEADREKIRAFAEAYGLVPCGEQTGANIGEAMAGNYAGERPEKAAGRPVPGEPERGKTGGVVPGRAEELLPERTEELLPERAEELLPGRAGKLLPERAEEKSDFRPTKQFMTGTEHEH